MRFDVEKAAKLTIEEGDRSGPRFTAGSRVSEEANENSVSTSGGYARTAGDEAPATYPPEKKSAFCAAQPSPNLSPHYAPARVRPALPNTAVLEQKIQLRTAGT